MYQNAKVSIYNFNEEFPFVISEGETLSDALSKVYKEFPENAVIYRGNQQALDALVVCKNDIDKMNLAIETGEFTVVLNAKYGIDILIYVAIAAAVLAAVALTMTMSMSVPNSASSGGSEGSNNSLTERENKTNLSGLVPEIFGTVLATPDLIQVPYSVYQNDREIEYAAMCIGRGRYHIDTNQIYDDTTRINSISGALVDIYNANQSPNNINDVRLYGTSETDEYDDVPWIVKKVNAVNGQELKYPNLPDYYPTDTFIIEGNNINNIIANFVAPQGIYRNNSGVLQWTATYFNIKIWPVDVNGDILSGYTVQQVDGGIGGDIRRPRAMTLRTNIYQSWWKEGANRPIDSESNATTKARMIKARSAILAVYAENVPPDTLLWVVRLKKNHATRGDQILLASYDGTNYGVWGGNFVNADSVANVYTQKTKRPVWVTIKKYTAFSSGTPNTDTIDTESNQVIKMLIDYRMLTSSVTDANGPVEFSATNTPPFDYLTFRDNIFYGGGFNRIAIQAVRTSPWTSYDAQYIEDVNLKSVYVLSSIKNEDFGNVTTCYSKTYATEGAMALKKRKLNMVVTRAIRCYNQNGDYITINGADNGSIVAPINSGTASVYSGSNPPYIATNRLDHIIVNILRDTVLGNFPITSIDFNLLYNLIKTISLYFASGDTIPSGVGSNYPLSVTATSFNYSYNTTDMSLQEMLTICCSINHITAYRVGSVVNFSFEGYGMTPKLLANHRNKMPNTNVRTVNFGSVETYDGVELDWTNAANNYNIETMKIPSTGIAVNPLRVEMAGIRNKRQAFRNAYRAFFSIFNKNIAEEFEGLPEFETLCKGMRIFSANNTSSKVLDGEIEAVSGSTLTLSEPADLTGLVDPVIILQHKNGSIQSLPIEQGTSTDKVVFTGTLNASLIVSDDYYAKTTYMIVSARTDRETSFIIEEREPSGENKIQKIKASNYNPVVYFADKITFWLQPLDVNFIDKTPNERTPIPKGSIYIKQDPSNIRSYCVYNDSPASYLTVNSSNPLVLASTFTMTAWIKLVASGTPNRVHAIFSSTNATSFRFVVLENSGVFKIQAIRGSTTDQTVEFTLSNATSQWNHVVVTFSNTTQIMNLYVNGDLKSTLTGVTTHSNPELYIAGNNSGGGFKGYLDGLTLHHDVLDGETIRNFYNFDKKIINTTKY